MIDGQCLALCQEMSISRAAFLRCLPAAVGGVAFIDAGTDIRYRDGGKGWRIAITPMPDIVLGAIRLPRQRVEIFLTGYDAASTRRFLDRFELYFRRGGG